MQFCYTVTARESETACEVRQADMFVRGISHQASDDEKRISGDKIARRKTSFMDKNCGMGNSTRLRQEAERMKVRKIDRKEKEGRKGGGE